MDTNPLGQPISGEVPSCAWCNAELYYDKHYGFWRCPNVPNAMPATAKSYKPDVRYASPVANQRVEKG